MSEFAYSDAGVERVLRGASLASGFNRWSGIRLIAAGAGQVCLELDVREEMTQHHGFVHGGIVGAFADTACSWAAATVGGDVVTSTYTVQFHAPAKGRMLRVRAAVIKQGKRNISVEAQLFAISDDAAERRVATALALVAPVNAASGGTT